VDTSKVQIGLGNTWNDNNTEFIAESMVFSLKYGSTTNFWTSAWLNGLRSKGMYNAREGMYFLSLPHHLEKTTNISGTMHYLL
jgi:hypothetical protein